MDNDANDPSLVIEEIFGDIKPEQPLEVADESEYPELVLQHTSHGIKHYASYQRHSRQFIESTKEIPLVRWKNSYIQRLQYQTLERTFIGTQAQNKSSTKSYSRPASSALFSWSSDEAYIESRKRELIRKGRKVSGTLQKSEKDINSKEEDEVAETSLIDKVKLKIPDQSIISGLNLLVENESNRFIHERIQLIKQHHGEQISKKINERKRKDHEVHLQRLKLKEEQYERELRAALEEKEKEKSKFLGIFTFGTSEPDHEQKQNHDEKKRFSFLPKTSIFGTSESKKEDLHSNVEPTTPKKSQAPDEPINTSLNIDSNELDQVFTVPENENGIDGVDEINNLQESPALEPVQETKITGHKFLPMTEPKPLIDFE